MKTATPALIDLLASTREYRISELITIILADDPVTPTILRYCTGDFKVTWAGDVYDSTGPIIKRGSVSTERGLSVDEVELVISTTNPAHTLIGMPFIKGIVNGGLDGAKVQIDRAYFEAWGDGPVGTLNIFKGRVSSIGDITRYAAQINVVSDVELLNVKIPKNIYTPNCPLNVYSPPCGANKAAKTVTGAVTAVIRDRVLFDTGLSQADGYFDLGVVTFTGGDNAGRSRTVKKYSSGTIEVALAWDGAVAVGDTFSIFPGCDKTMSTCKNRFNNLSRFRGFPFIPAPETIT